MGVSTFSIAPMEKIASTGAGLLAQIYVLRDRAITRDMLARAAGCGIKSIIVTVDTAITPIRERDIRNGFRHLSRPTLSQMLGLAGRPAWLAGLAGGSIPTVGNIDRYTTSRGVMAQARDVAAQIDPTLNRDDLAWLRENWTGQLIVKGIMHPDDAVQAVDAGADGIIVSNHGGRLDSGIRRGGEVVTALALGATAVAIGRPWAWALAAGGAPGVGAALDTLAQEIRDVMALAGLCDIEAIRTAGRDMLWKF
ncbi:hypothetical protein AOE01nite_30580 [Acetobacter oeni]|uniref:FMN hydroxy acid dehydrogenase domain-containing protein n=1 Tax=Acetobacter oeni TaxID=304077 RepID=A0A511XPK4_9PROT|nr:alpha-hydroxy acid oxidase [Acetobacter oeni]NHO20564.1 hypothetical protein [Acetobacter oeni]GEN64834.1 hypothetical protein AOE01nite_30580 [Acetobacter oeni]